MATRSPIPDRAPPISNGLVQRTSIILARILKGITIEPAVFILAFASSIDNIAVSQMVAIKSCKFDFGWNDTVCDNLESDEFHEENVQVSEELAQFKVYETLITHIFPVFFSFFLGAWADLFGRKPLFYMFLISYALEEATLILCAYFSEWPKEYLLFSYIPGAISGICHLNEYFKLNVFLFFCLSSVSMLVYL